MTEDEYINEHVFKLNRLIIEYGADGEELMDYVGDDDFSTEREVTSA